MRRVLVALSLGGSVCLAGDARAICRVVTEIGSPSPAVTGAQPILFALRRDVPVGCGAAADAGVPVLADGGVPGDAGAGDAGAPCAPRLANVVSMAVQPKLSIGSDGARFALIMATPRPPLVELAPETLFSSLAQQTKPYVIRDTRYIEDPALGYQCQDPKWDTDESAGGCGMSSREPTWEPPPPDEIPEIDAGLPDEPDPTLIGGYEVVALGSPDAAALIAWLDTHGYVHTAADEEAIAAYVARGWTIVVVRVQQDAAVVDGALAPLSFTWEGDELVIPAALSRSAAGGEEPVVAYVAADGRRDFPGGHVSYAQWSPAIAGTSFLTRTDLWVDLSRTADEDPRAFVQPANEPARDTETIIVEIRIPSSECPRDDEAEDTYDPPPSSPPERRQSLCGCRLDRRSRALPGTGLLLLAAAAVLAGRRVKGR